MKALALVVLAGCSSAMAPRYPRSAPPRLPDAVRSVAPERVLVSFAPFTWAGTVGTEHEFRVLISIAARLPGDDGRRLGPLRTADLALTGAQRIGLYCAWGPGKDEHCADDAAADTARAQVLATIAALRADAAEVGATEVRDVRCFVHAIDLDGALWCEAIAFADTPGVDAAVDLDAAIQPRARAAPSRWKLAGAFTAGRYGDTVVIGQTLGASYRGVELATHVVSPPAWSSIGVGLDLLVHPRLRGQASAIVGLTAMLLAPLEPGVGKEREATATRGAVGPVVGLRWVAKDFSLFDGFGKPFAEVRLGWLGSTKAGHGEQLAGLNLEALVGLTTP